MEHEILVRVWTPVDYYWRHRPYTVKGSYGAVDQKPDDITALGITRPVKLDCERAGGDSRCRRRYAADGGWRAEPRWTWRRTVRETGLSVGVDAVAPEFHVPGSVAGSRRQGERDRDS